MAKVELNGAVGIKCNLPNGIYTLGMLSCTGKTRLCKLLKLYNRGGKNVDSFSFEEVGKIDPPSSGDLVLFDRFDKYSDRYIDTIKNISKSGVVLLDLKRLPRGRLGMIDVAKIDTDGDGNITIR